MFAPGVVFIARKALVVGVPVASSAALIRKLAVSLGFSIPTWVLLSACAASVPFYTTLRLLLRYLRQRREAATMGARLAPTTTDGKWPGNLDLLLNMMKIWKYGYPGDGLREVLEQVGPTVNLRVLYEDIIITTCPEHLKLILATDFNNYVKGDKFQYAMSSVLGTGVFNSDGKLMWKFHRAMTRPFFSRDRISHFEIFDRHADQVISHLKTRMKTGYAVDFQDLIGRFTMDSASEFLLGSCVNSLHASLPLPHNAPPFTTIESDSGHAQVAMAFLAAFNESMLHICNRARVGWAWPLTEMWYDKTVEPMKIVSAYIDPIIQEAVEKKKLANSLHVNSDKQEDEDRADGSLLDELLNSTSAGKDTTQWTTTVIVYFLATHPSVNARLRQEILQHVGPTRRPTYDDIRDMKYLRAVINEAMRLYPSSYHFFNRESINATTWPSPDPNEKPIYIPAGTQVPYSVILMHRRKDLWGPDAEEFDPDRWLDERLKTYLLANSFQFLPFNAGPRICLGQQFAYNEMSFILVRLLQNFSSFSLETDAFRPETRPAPEWAALEGRKGADKFWARMHLTMYSEGGMWLKMQEAETV
ncbi:cytochrome P450, partial [Mycena pura]